MKRILTLFIILLINVVVWADGILPPEFMPYNTITSVRLPYFARQAMTVFKDKDDIVWIGTALSLVRYDGFSSQDYLTNKGAIMDIDQYDDHHLLIGLHKGLILFNTTNGLEEELPKPLKKVNSARTLLVNGSSIWIGSDDNGLFLYDLKRKALTHCKSNSRLTGVYKICQVGRKLYVAGLEGLFVADINSRQVKLRKFPEISCFVNSLLWDNRTGILYIGTEGELYTYKPSTQTFSTVKALHGNVCKSMSLDKTGNLVVGTDAGLCFYNIKSGKSQVLRQNGSGGVLDSDIIWDIITSHSGNLWLATQNGFSVMSLAKGCEYYDLHNISTPNNFTSMLVDHHKRLWLGGENGITVTDTKTGLTRNFNATSTTSPLRHNHIRNIYEDHDGFIWIASDASIARYNEQSGRFEYVTLVGRNKEVGNWAYSLYEDSRGRMWISTYSAGVFCIDKKKLEACLGSTYHDLANKTWLEKLKLERCVASIIPGEKEELWLKGNSFIIRYNIKTDKEQVYSDGVTYSDYATYCNHTIWLTNRNGKMMKFDRKSDRFVMLPVTLPSGRIMSAVSQGTKLWLSCSNAFVSFDTKTYKTTYYGRSKYLLLSGLLDLQNKEIIFGGENILARFNPAFQPIRQRAYITRVFVNGDKEEMLMPQIGSEINLKRDHNFVINLSTLNYSSSEEVTFYYKLGDDKNWQELKSGTSELDFARLASGTYNLHISASNPNVDSNAIITSYIIKVPYPWYATGWAFVLYFILLLIMVILIVLRQRRNVRRRMIAEEREHTLESLKQRNEYFARLTQQMKEQAAQLAAVKSGNAEKPVEESETKKPQKETEKQSPEAEKQIDEVDEKFLKEIDDIIEKNIDDDTFGVSILAEKAGMPQKQLYRRIKQITDTTPVAYIRNYRLKKAAELLKEGRYTANEVMYSVGFNNMSYFIKCFSAEYNMTPKQYMEQ